MALIVTISCCCSWMMIHVVDQPIVDNTSRSSFRFQNDSVLLVLVLPSWLVPLHCSQKPLLSTVDMSSSSSTANLFCFFVTGVDFAGWSPSSHFVFQARLVPPPLDCTIVDNKGVIIDDAPPFTKCTQSLRQCDACIRIERWRELLAHISRCWRWVAMPDRPYAQDNRVCQCVRVWTWACHSLSFCFMCSKLECRW
jgi:hypothetical protein